MVGIHIAKKVTQTMRQAFTMIELIFAIVVISVVVLTVPMMIQVNNKAIEGNSAQEAIFLVSSVLSSLTTRLWDKNSTKDINGNYTLSKMLDVDGTGNAAYNRINANSTVRVGGLEQDMHRQFFSSESRPRGDENLSFGFNEVATGESFGLKSKYDISVIRFYINDDPAGFFFGTADAGIETNIKMTEVIISGDLDADGIDENITVLRAYTCNIGEIDFAKRRF